LKLKSLKSIDLDLLDALSVTAALWVVSSLVEGADWEVEVEESACGLEDTSGVAEVLATSGVELDESVDAAA
jgi:hypothetical protein